MDLLINFLKMSFVNSQYTKIQSFVKMFFIVGLEKQIRDKKAPRMLDIDGDICHHVHNATKKFCSPFKYIAENLFKDLHNDFKWSPDLRDVLAELCSMMNISFTMPERFISHR